MLKKIRIVSCLLLIISLFMMYDKTHSTTVIANAKIFMESSESNEYIEGDMNKNGRIDLQDVILLLKKYLGIDIDNNEEIELPVPSLNATVSVNGSNVPHCEEIDGFNQCYYVLEASNYQTVFTTDSSRYSDLNVSGFEVYKKNGTQYTSVGSSDDITGSVLVGGQTNGIYVVRVYTLDNNNQMVYSDYSPELEVSSPNPPGVGYFVYNYSTEDE